MTRLSPSRAPRFIGREAIQSIENLQGGHRCPTERETAKLVLRGLAAIVFLPVITVLVCSYLAPHIRQFLGL